MSDTPRTDAKAWRESTFEAVHADFARELERENAKLREAVATANAKLDRLRSLPKFAGLLAAHGIVQGAAVFEAEGYDCGETLNRIAGAHAEIWASL